MLLLCLRVCLFFLESFISVEVRKARSHDFMQIASISLVRYHIVQSFFLKNKHDIDIKYHWVFVKLIPNKKSHMS